jgi:hypothetical protein
VLSYGLAGHSPLNPILREIARIARHVPVAGYGLERFVSGQTSLEQSHATAAVLYAVPLLWLSAAFVFLLRTARRHSALIDARTVALLFWFAVSFAGVNVLAYPVFTADMWAYIAQGRMFSSGHNGYYEPVTAEATEGLQLDPFYERSRMAYGPLWAIGSAVAARGAGHRLIAEYALLKIGLAALWILTLVLIRGADPGASPARTVSSLLVFGWIPVSVHQTVAEAHNDVAMVCLVVLWLALILGGRGALAPFALWASVAVKYASAPLLLAEAVRCWFAGTKRVMYMSAMLAAGTITAGLFAVFWRGPGFFADSFSMQTWSFFTPADAVATVSRFVGMPDPVTAVLATLIRASFVVPALYHARRFFVTRTDRSFCELVLAFSCLVLLGASSYVWPWYALWILAPAALAIESAMLRIVVPYALAIPFVQLLWILHGVERYRHRASVLLWVLTAAAAIFWRSLRDVVQPDRSPDFGDRRISTEPGERGLRQR